MAAMVAWLELDGTAMDRFLSGGLGLIAPQP
jgi:hypothetical protein